MKTETLPTPDRVATFEANRRRLCKFRWVITGTWSQIKQTMEKRY